MNRMTVDSGLVVVGFITLVYIILGTKITIIIHLYDKNNFR